METTQTNDADATVTHDQPFPENYLPGGPNTSTEASRVERFVTNLFRRRGSYRLVLTRGD
jgi:hypothetical protein